MSSEKMTIGRLAAAAGVNVETVRYYQRRGLMPEPGKPQSGVRTYGSPALARLLFIRRAQPLGFSLDEIKELLELQGGGACSRTLQLTEAKLIDIRLRLAELRRLESELLKLVGDCQRAPSAASCPTLDFLDNAR